MKAKPGAYLVGGAISGASAAIGAAVADRHPSLGAAVGSSVLTLIGTGLMVIGDPLGKSKYREEIGPALLYTAPVAGGSALGAAMSSEHPALGAFAGGALTFALELALLSAINNSSDTKQVGTNGPLHLSAGGFP